MSDILGKLKFNDSESWFDVLWIALDNNRDNFNDKEWDEICTAMTWIKSNTSYNKIIIKG